MDKERERILIVLDEQIQEEINNIEKSTRRLKHYYAERNSYIQQEYKMRKTVEELNK